MHEMMAANFASQFKIIFRSQTSWVRLIYSPFLNILFQKYWNSFTLQSMQIHFLRKKDECLRKLQFCGPTFKGSCQSWFRFQRILNQILQNILANNKCIYDQIFTIYRVEGFLDETSKCQLNVNMWNHIFLHVLKNIAEITNFRSSKSIQSASKSLKLLSSLTTAAKSKLNPFIFQVLFTLGWNVILKCDIEMWHWNVMLKCDIEMWYWNVILKCDIEMWYWDVTLKCDVGMWYWNIILVSSSTKYVSNLKIFLPFFVVRISTANNICMNIVSTSTHKIEIKPLEVRSKCRKLHYFNVRRESTNEVPFPV